MSCYERMNVHCPICTKEMDGMRPYGHDSHCCTKACHDEWEWRRTLAILKQPYRPKANQTQTNPT
jgi:hypothetical protein